jgi:arylsulfatase A-like enzyme
MARSTVALLPAVAMAVAACGSTQPSASPTTGMGDVAGSGRPSVAAAIASISPRPTPTPPPTPDVGVPVATLPAEPDGRKANVLLIIADDFGIDLSPCYDVGTDKPRMPNLERMCDEGLVFDTMWASPLCTPSRATLLTAQYGFRTDVVQVGDVLKDTPSVMDALEKTDPAYDNAIVGKWHLTDTDPIDPNAPAQFGVQHYAGFLGGFTDDFFSWDYAEDGVEGHSDTYTTTWMTDTALDWIGHQGDDPWFLWLAENEPHFPFHLPPTTLQHYSELTGDEGDVAGHPRAYVKAQAEALDTEMGRLLASMDPGVRANTTVIFMGDNGTDPDVIGMPYPSWHGKFTVYEGGIRVPLVVAGAGVTRRGEREDALVEAVDVPATVLDLAGADGRFHDGRSFAAALTDPSFVGRDHLYMDAIRAEPFSGGRPGWAVRDASWKLIEYDDGGRELYDVRTDIGETQNLIESGVPDDLRTVYEDLESYGKRVRGSGS